MERMTLTAGALAGIFCSEMLLSDEKSNRGCCMSQSDSRSAAANHLSVAVMVLAVLCGGVLLLLGPPCTSKIGPVRGKDLTTSALDAGDRRVGQSKIKFCRHTMPGR